MVAYTFNTTEADGSLGSEASLGYSASSRTARTTWRNPALRNQKQQQKPNKVSVSYKSVTLDDNLYVIKQFYYLHRLV